MVWPARHLATVAAVALFAAAILLRVGALFLPGFAESNYEEAGVGLMAQGILAGRHIVFWWAVPYLGTLEVYATALLFALLPDTTLVLRLTPLVMSMVAVAFAYLLARDVLGPRWSLAVLAWWALPPVYLLRLSVTPYNYIGSVAYGNLLLYLTHRAVHRSPRPTGIWYLMGLVAGLAFWHHLISVAYIGAAGLWVAAHFARQAGDGSRPAALRRALLQPAYARGALGFLLGSAPFWVWNALHRFETFRAMVRPAAGSGILARLGFVFARPMPDVLGRGHPPWADPAASPFLTVAIWALYAPALAYGLYALVAPALRRPREAGPGTAAPPGLGLAVLAFVLAAAQVVLGEYSQPRYLMPIYSSLPLLFAAWARAVARRLLWAGVALVVAVLLVHGADLLRFYRVDRRQHAEPRPVDALVAFLHQEGIAHVYAHYRVAWPLAFESGGRVTASDLHGYLTNQYYLRGRSAVYMTPFFEAMEAVDRAPRVAFVTHEGLQLPRADELEHALRLLGGSHRTTRVGRYTVFHDFRPPSRNLREVPPAAVTLRSSHQAALAPEAGDRNIMTVWKSGEPQRPGMWVEATLDRPRRLVRLVLDQGGRVIDGPAGVRVEVSPDGAAWTEVLSVPHHLGGIDWLGDHPKLNVRGKLGLWFDPVEARRVRVTQVGSARGAPQWSIAELFLYEEGPPGAATPAPFFIRDAEAPALAAFVAGRGIEAVYSTDEGNLVLTGILPRSVRTVTLRDKRYTRADKSERVVRLERTNGFLLPAASPEVEATLARRGVRVEAHRFESGVLYVTAPRPDAPPLYWDHERLLEATPH